MQVIKYQFQQHGDERGQLVALEEFKDIPFQIKRVYYMYDTIKDMHRGCHAHKNLEQILFCVCGTCKVLLDDGTDKKVVILDKPSSLGNSLKMQQKNRPYKRIQQVGEKNVHFKIVQGNFPEKRA